MDMYEKSLLTLELPAVLELLAAEASSDAAMIRPGDAPRLISGRNNSG